MGSPEKSRYTLVICEKPDAANRVADALANGQEKSFLTEGVTAFRFSRGHEHFVVCSAIGHVFSISDPFKERTVFPVFDAEWFASQHVEKGNSAAAGRIAAIAKLAKGADRLVNACDFDVEGETIGFNVMKYACGGREGEAARVKFSTLTRDEILEAFESLESNPKGGLAAAGRTRHVIDFVWGVNLSRVLSQSVSTQGFRFRTVSIGRVQGPALKFLVDRELDIRGFVPEPYWKVEAIFYQDGRKFVAAHSEGRIKSRSEAEGIREVCSDKDGVVSVVAKNMINILPPPPFNIGDLQRESYRAFGLSPTKTLQIAERLYLGAFISYPRTDSQKLPPSLNLRKILVSLQSQEAYSKAVGAILKRDLKPVQGAKFDPAHPAIHPTSERPRKTLGSIEARLYDMVTRRFLAAFGPSAMQENSSAEIDVGGQKFKLTGSKVVFSGWTAIYRGYRGAREGEFPRLSQGDRLRVAEIPVEERFEERPLRYNQGTLLEKMEREKIGTKATRADVISTLLARGYVSGTRMAVTDLGLSVSEILEKYAPSIVTTGLTRSIEERLESIEEGGDSKELMRETIRSVHAQVSEIALNEESIGREIDGSYTASLAATNVLGPCPVCRTGSLRVIRSRATRKRFAGCSNYPTVCRASAPLPQRGGIRPTPYPCKRCSWPVILVGGRRTWKLCINPNCPLKAQERNELPAM